jgi:hypothetical protein
VNEYERSLLTDARDRIESKDNHFLCCAVEDAHFDREDFAGNIGLMEALRTRIQEAIDGAYTLERYIYINHGMRPERISGGRDFYDNYVTLADEITYLPRRKFDNFVLQCRLAWIDRMLDNDEVR